MRFCASFCYDFPLEDLGPNRSTLVVSHRGKTLSRWGREGSRGAIAFILWVASSCHSEYRHGALPALWRYSE